MSGTFRITDFFDPHAVRVSEFFGIGENRKLFLPDHQRNYAWEEAELEDLWVDFKNVVKDTLDENNDYVERPNLRPYFLGRIVLTNKDRDYEIIDGQQRITTITIFSRAFVDIAHRITDVHRKVSLINALSRIYSYIHMEMD